MDIFHVSEPKIIENPSQKVGNFLGGLGGISVSSENGEAIKDFSDRKCLGILYGGNLLLRGKLIGVIWFDNPDMGANERDWILHYFEPKYRDITLNILGKILTEFGIPMIQCISRR